MNTNTGISLGTVAIAVIALLFVSGSILTNQQAFAAGGGGGAAGGGDNMSLLIINKPRT
jgi:hypothetical protein